MYDIKSLGHTVMEKMFNFFGCHGNQVLWKISDNFMQETSIKNGAVVLDGMSF